MREKMKRMGTVLLASVMMLVISVQNGSVVTAYANTATGRVPMVCYTSSIGRVNTYTSSGSYSGYIDGYTDKVTILKVYDYDWCYVKYPTSRGSKKAYTKSSNFFCNTNFSEATTTLGVRKTVYRRSDLSQTIGTVYADDSVVIVGTAGNNTQIIYPVSGGYKLGWVSGIYAASKGEENANVSNGYYQIKSALNSDYVLDIYGGSMDNSANLQIYKNNFSTNQGFLIKKQTDGYYTIAAIHSGKVLDVDHSYKADGTNVMQFTKHGGDNQKWKIVKTSDGYYSFISKCNGLYLDVANGNAANETNVWCYTGNGSGAQKFILESVTVDGNGYQDEESSAPQESAGSMFQYPMQNAYVCGNNWKSYYSARPSRPYHVGLDLASSSGDTNIYAAADGTVARTGWNSANGNYVVLKHTIDGKTVYSFYAHLRSYCVTSGSASKGTKIGVMGNTGSGSAGAHLHFGIVDTLWSGSYYGYVPYFSGNKTTYSGVTYYNPAYVIQNNRLP